MRLAVLVAALGYFVDIYDLILFTVVRKVSLAELGVPPDQSLARGFLLMNMQMGGMLVGGIAWGVLGDLRGRKSVLFGSIFLYSVANLLNGLVATIPQYAALRFIAGVGLAGELGAGITLVAEILPADRRGYGTTAVAAVGILGAVVAALVGDALHWRTAYFVGGGLGLALLLLRVGVTESGLFEGAKRAGVSRGNLLLLFADRARLGRYLAVVVVGVPIWYAIGILVAASPELGKAMGMSAVPATSKAVLCSYAGLAAGDLASGLLSQRLRSRKRAVLVFLALTALGIGLFFTVGRTSLAAFYASCCVLGFGAGYWAVFVTVASEQFGTNVRATATTTAPNFVRGSVVLLTTAFEWLAPRRGPVGAALVLGGVVMGLAFVALASLGETYGKDLDFHER